METFENHLRKTFPGSENIGPKGVGMTKAEAMIGRFIGLRSNEYTEDFDLSIDQSEETMLDITKTFYTKHGFKHRTDIPSQAVGANPIILTNKDDLTIGVTITKFPDRMRFTVSVV